MLRRLGRLVSCAMVLAAPGAWAEPGDLEINQACATGPGCFAGDAPGFPVQISAAGSYRLTGNLVVPSENTDAIQVLVLATPTPVTIDLGGHEIRGPVVCSGSPIACVPGSGTGRGIGSSADRTAVRNGH